jgi:hypothetical protein
VAPGNTKRRNEFEIRHAHAGDLSSLLFHLSANHFVSYRPAKHVPFPVEATARYGLSVGCQFVPWCVLFLYGYVCCPCRGVDSEHFPMNDARSANMFTLLVSLIDSVKVSEVH